MCLPVGFFASGGSGNRGTLGREGILEYIARDSAEPRHLTKLVLNPRILEPRLAPVRNAEACFSAVGLGLDREPMPCKDTARKVPDSAVTAALSRVSVFVGVGPRERRV
jgi:hypothetical protein